MKSPKKNEMAGKMVSKEYKTTRCGHCGKFGHHHSTHKAKKYDLVGNIMAHESGELDEKGTRELFNHLNEKGLTNKLQGHYGRTNEAIKRGDYFK